MLARDKQAAAVAVAVIGDEKNYLDLLVLDLDETSLGCSEHTRAITVRHEEQCAAEMKEARDWRALCARSKSYEERNGAQGRRHTERLSN